MTEKTCRYAWCRDHQDVGDNGEPTHTSRTTTVTVPKGSDGGVRPMPEPLKLLSADLFYDEIHAESSVAVWISSGGMDELVLDRAQAERLADDLEGFIRDLRDLAAYLPIREAA